MPAKPNGSILMISLHGYVGATPELGKPDTGGQVVFVLELAKRFARLGYKVDVLTRQFEDRKVEKDYLAILDGEPPEAEGSIDAPIRLSTTSPIELEMTTAAHGLPCRTDWRVLEVAGGYTLVKLRLHTGRQHQIRVHMAALGAPLVGDKLYGPDNTIFLRAAAGELTDVDPAQVAIGNELEMSFRHLYTAQGDHNYFWKARPRR